MKKKIIFLTLFGLLICFIFSPVTSWAQNNSRPVTVSTKRPTLQSVLDSVFGKDAVDAYFDQEAAGMWFVGSYPSMVNSELVVEYSDLSGDNVFGIWSWLNMQNRTTISIPIFLGGAGSKKTAILSWDSTGKLTIAGDSATVNTGTFSGIDPCSFGFFLKRNGTTFYTLDELNSGETAQALAYKSPDSDMWVIAFNDLPRTSLDYDYNDLVVKLDFLKAWDAGPFAPTLVSPTDGASWVDITNPNDPSSTLLQLSWNKSCGAGSYRLQIATEPSFSNPVSYNTAGISQPVTGLSNDTTYYWRVGVPISGGTFAWSETWDFATAPYYGNIFAILRGTIDPDNDGDGLDDGLVNVNDGLEGILGTDPTKKTLFIRPKYNDGTYWPGFISLFPDSRPGFANIPQLTSRGIETVVIGASGHTYTPFNDFSYNPATDTNIAAYTNKPDILEIIYYPSTTNNICPYQTHDGHLYFPSPTSGWSWDTKGFTWGTATIYGYRTASICEYSLNKYFTEGPYSKIATKQRALCTDCSTCNCNQKSTMNLSGSYPSYGLPNGDVEFNAFTFSDYRGTIKTVPSSPANPYTTDDVRRRTIVHELGHALLSGTNADHCNDPQCIMYGSTSNWNMYSFGGPTNQYGCTHRPGLSNDISNKIHNSIK